MKVPVLPATQQRPVNIHRRGHSFDQRSPIRRQHTGMVSIANVGTIHQHGQQILREAQQQRIVRPGQQPQQQQIDLPGSPHCGVSIPVSHPGPEASYDHMTTMNNIMQHGGHIQYAHAPYYIPDINMPTPINMDGFGMPVDENNMQYFNPMHASYMNILPERRQSQPDLHIQTELRPLTPTNQLQTGKQPNVILHDCLD